MVKKNVLFLMFFLSCANILLAQNKIIRFKNGSVRTDENLLKTKFFDRYQKSIAYHNNIYALVQLDKTPDVEAIKSLQSAGVFLHNLVSANTFLAEIKQQFITNLPQNIIGIYKIPANAKIDKRFLENSSVTNASTAAAVMFFGSVDKETVKKEILKTGATLTNTKIDPNNTIFVNASPEVVQKIAALPFVNYIGRQTLKDVPLNYNNRATHSLDALNNPLGRNLQGKGITVGIGDNANPATHIDFGARLLVRTPTIADLHGTHVTGTVGGAGNLNPMYKGMAPQTTLINQYYSDIIVNAPVYINDNHMVLTNNSYYSGEDNCPGDGEYDALSNYADDQLNNYQNLLHVFAAGNDGAITCSPFPQSYATIKSGFQCAKNVLTVGAIENALNYIVWQGSSRGPVDDGRLKPEIVAGGAAITSTYPNNTYATTWGTSMASPTVTGTLALLYERYRQLNGGSDPSGALIKAIACNTAEDKGNPGPDFTFGFGMLNARRAVEAVENRTYFTNTINNRNVQTQTLNNIPAGAQVKVMLYWSDPAAAPNAVKELINDLDLTVTDGSGSVHHPLVLDPSNVTANAMEGVDNLNNIEQVVINNAAGGNFTISVKGTSVATGSQSYVIAYQVLQPSVTVEYPSGNEVFLPNTTETLRWTYYGNDTNTFSVDYSLDNGTTWTNIRNNVSPDSTIVNWTVPNNVASNQALIRVTRNNTGISDVSDNNFTVLGQPTVATTSLCTGYGRISWSSIASATSYNILKFNGDTMQTIASVPQSAGTIFYYLALNADSTYYLSVEPVINGAKGRRAIAKALIANTGDCSDAALNNNFAMDSIISPTTGRLFTSTAIQVTAPVTVRLRNGDNVASTGSYSVSYQVNNGSVVTENSSTSIPANSTAVYTFASTYDFSAPGTYTLKTWVKHTGDLRTDDDTLVTVIRQLENAPITLSPSYTEDFESAASQTYISKTTGLTGLDRGDFNTNSPSQGRARTFVNTGFARSGSKCITLDRIINASTSAADSLTLTFNLSNYTSSDQLWLDLFYKNQGIDFILPGNKIWIRGSDTSVWLPVYNLPAKVADFGIYKPIQSVNIIEVLTAASQKISSSFQVRLGEEGYTSANSVMPAGDIDDGYSFDDVMISKAANDIGMKSLLTPDTSNLCQLGSAEVVKVLLKNYSSTAFTNIPVSYSVNGITVTETIPTLPPGDFTYTFNQTADLSAFRQYSMKVWAKNSSDNYPNNDTLPEITFQTVPLINTFPYIEGFENNNGNWYSAGNNNSWQWGTPAKSVINKAANGSKIWTTGLTGGYNDNELSYLYSPCFDVSALTQPMLSFSHIFELEACDCDAHWVEYSTDGINWMKLGTAGNGTNWYNNSAKNIWQQPSLTKWHVASYDLPAGVNKLRLRFVMSSDPASSFDGVGIDDINIFDKAAIYSGANLATGIVQNVSGNNWVDFNDASGKRIVSVNANGQDLGTVTAKVFFNPNTPIRVSTGQYYLDRNIVVQTANAPTDSVSVRFYFLDVEAQKLINATGCATCTTISDPYECGVTQYSGPSSEEDGTLINNNSGVFRFILPHDEVKIIPYNSGYYAEYKVNRFSEFWINNGGPNNNQPLPLNLLSFTAVEKNTSGILNWRTANEINTLKFVIEKSTDGIHFSSIGEVPSFNNSTANSYAFTDSNLVAGQNYYRLKMVDVDEKFAYSPVRTINYETNNFNVLIYPNPVTGNTLYITTSANCTRLELKDVAGKRIQVVNTSGKQNTLNVNGISKGLYFLLITTDNGIKVEKIIKN